MSAAACFVHRVSFRRAFFARGFGALFYGLCQALHDILNQDELCHGGLRHV